MDDRGAEADIAALIRIRRQLTVALLAVEHLCRRVGALPPVTRLCAIAKDALLHIRDEVVRLEERVPHRTRYTGASSGEPSDAVDDASPAP